MPQTRREFFAAVGVLAASTGLHATHAHAAAVEQRLLVSGGGPHSGEETRRRGPQETLLSRGKTNPQVFPGGQRLPGARSTNL